MASTSAPLPGGVASSSLASRSAPFPAGVAGAPVSDPAPAPPPSSAAVGVASASLADTLPPSVSLSLLSVPIRAGRSFKEVTAGNRGVACAVSTRDGVPALLFSKEVLANLALPFSRTLVGKVSGRPPPIHFIKAFFRSLRLMGEVFVDEMRPAVFIFRFSQDLDYNRIFAKRFLDIRGAIFSFSKWSPDLDLSLDSPVIPVWITLPALRFQFGNPSVLWNIASLLGSPLQMDSATANGSRLFSARILVEVDISTPLPTKIWLGSDLEAGVGYFQEVVVENLPVYCNSCSSLAHGLSDCPFSTADGQSDLPTVLPAGLLDVPVGSVGGGVAPPPVGSPLPPVGVVPVDSLVTISVGSEMEIPVLEEVHNSQVAGTTKGSVLDDSGGCGDGSSIDTMVNAPVVVPTCDGNKVGGLNVSTYDTPHVFDTSPTVPIALKRKDSALELGSAEVEVAGSHSGDLELGAGDVDLGGVHSELEFLADVPQFDLDIDYDSAPAALALRRKGRGKNKKYDIYSLSKSKTVNRAPRV